MAITMNNHVILLNGASSTGKTTLARAIQRKLLNDHGLHSLVLSVDDVLRSLSIPYDSVLACLAKTKLPIIEIFHATVAASAKAGAWTIVDHVIGEDPVWVNDLLSRLDNTPLLTINLTCSLADLQNREEHRTDRPSNWEHAKRQARDIYTALPAHLVLDNSIDSTAVCLQKIFSRLFSANSNAYVK